MHFEELADTRHLRVRLGWGFCVPVMGWHTGGPIGHHPENCKTTMFSTANPSRMLGPRLWAPLRKTSWFERPWPPKPQNRHCLAMPRPLANPTHSPQKESVQSYLEYTKDTLAERLRRRPAKPMGSPRVGSNPTGVVFDAVLLHMINTMWLSGQSRQTPTENSFSEWPGSRKLQIRIHHDVSR